MSHTVRPVMGSTETDKWLATDVLLTACKRCDFIHLPTDKNYIYPFVLYEQRWFHLHLKCLTPESSRY